MTIDIYTKYRGTLAARIQWRDPMHSFSEYELDSCERVNVVEASMMHDAPLSCDVPQRRPPQAEAMCLPPKRVGRPRPGKPHLHDDRNQSVTSKCDSVPWGKRRACLKKRRSPSLVSTICHGPQHLMSCSRGTKAVPFQSHPRESRSNMQPKIGTTYAV